MWPWTAPPGLGGHTCKPQELASCRGNRAGSGWERPASSCKCEGWRDPGTQGQRSWCPFVSFDGTWQRLASPCQAGQDHPGRVHWVCGQPPACTSGVGWRDLDLWEGRLSGWGSPALSGMPLTCAGLWEALLCGDRTKWGPSSGQRGPGGGSALERCPVPAPEVTRHHPLDRCLWGTGVFLTHRLMEEMPCG